MTSLVVLKDNEISELKDEVRMLRETTSNKDETIVKLIEKSYESIQAAMKEQRLELATEHRAERSELLKLLNEAIKPDPSILTPELRISK